MVIKIELTPLSLSDCKIFPFKKGFKKPKIDPKTHRLFRLCPAPILSSIVHQLVICQGHQACPYVHLVPVTLILGGQYVIKHSFRTHDRPKITVSLPPRACIWYAIIACTAVPVPVRITHLRPCTSCELANPSPLKALFKGIQRYSSL